MYRIIDKEKMLRGITNCFETARRFAALVGGHVEAVEV
jgi:hypothetical protein